MTTQEMKKALEGLKKAELISAFTSLKLKPAVTKAVIIESILNGKPAESEIEAFKASLPEEVESPKPTVYIVVHPISEDGTLYERGEDYEGKRVDRFMRDGQIKVK